MMKKMLGPVVSALSVAERADVLVALIEAHPELAAEAERLAGSLLAGHGRERTAHSIAAELRGLHLGDLAGRAGPRWDGGHVDPVDAAYELVQEAVQPYLDDVARRARAGARAAALEVGLGLLSGLYGCRHEDDPDLVLVQAGLPDVIDHQVDHVIAAMDKAGLPIPDGWMADQCPEWT
ncbi:hypothetical protein [Streptosporangium subroseum]|uniref:hypothetical protein n=1 Tax=Streptosporangium subroseum TaxID=106412 RepID=UPI0030938906|nr:hypothetical protein OHB15_34910 [Streptosporangium subroseum]